MAEYFVPEPSATHLCRSCGKQTAAPGQFCDETCAARDRLARKSFTYASLTPNRNFVEQR